MTSAAIAQAADAPAPLQGRPSNSLHFTIGEMNGKLDVLLGLRGDMDRIDGRVTNLEIWRGRAAGGTAVLILVLGSLEVIRYAIAN